MKLVVANQQHYEKEAEAAARVDGSNPKCVCFVINSRLIIGAPNVERQEDTFMQFTGQREIKFDQDETDSLTNWILGLAIGMIVLGTAFALLDWCDLLPVPAAAGSRGLTHATVIKEMSDGAGFVRLSRERRIAA
jgi:hypothetical protein